MSISSSSLEALLFQYIDKLKFLFFPDQWNSVFLDFTKNEVFALILIYRSRYVKMSEAAAYLGVPLNTATGVISRLEKKQLAIRERNAIDKRVVTISMTKKGEELIHHELQAMADYVQRLFEVLTEEEIQLSLKIFDKVFEVLNQGQSSQDTEQQDVSRVRRIQIE